VYTRATLTAVIRVGIRELRNQVSRLVRRAAAGERIVITVDGKPTAQLGPLNDGSSRPTRDDLIAAGKLIPRRRTGPPPEPTPVPSPTGLTSEEILRDLRSRG